MVKKHLIWLIFLLGLLLRLVNLDQSFWLDEASQAQMSSFPVREIWFGRSGDFHPPLFYIIAHYWLLFGHSEIWLRLPSVFFGIAAVWVIYHFSNTLFSSQKIAYLSAFLLAVNPYHIYYSQEFRSYSLLMLLGLLSMYALTKKHWTLFLINALLLYTHYSSIFLIITQIIYVAFFDRKLLRFVIGHLALVIILFLPWLPQFFHQFQSGIRAQVYLPGWRDLLTVPTIKSVPLVLFKLTAGRINLLPKIIYGLYIVFVLSVVVTSVALLRHKRPLLLFWSFGPLLLSILISLKIPQTQPFRLIFILPALVLIFAQTSARFPKTFLTLLIYIAITGNFLYFTRPRLQREQWRQAIAFLASQNAPAVVKFTGPFSPFTWYNPNQVVISALPSLPAQPSRVANALAAVSTPKVFLLDYLGEVTDPQNLVATTLTNIGFSQVKTYNFEGVGFIHEYSKL